jgi:DNA-binding MarR family transcriptional regulator
MKTRLPLPALLSQAYVAFAIEFDNEFEHLAPHRTTNYGSTPGFPAAPWLVSMALWLRFMRYIPVEGTTVADLQSHLAISNKGLNIWLARLGRWWRYFHILDPGASETSKRIRPQALIRPTAGGRKAIEVWQTLIPVVEARWRDRFGEQSFAALEDALRKIAVQLDPAAPAHFAILEHEDKKSRAARAQLPAGKPVLPELLARVLLAFAAEFDSQSAASLSSVANVLRVTPDSGIRVRDLPRLTWLAPSGVADALRELKYARLGSVKADPSGSRSKVLMITLQARLARDGYLPLAERIEKEWKKRFGEEPVNQLRTSLEEIVQSRDGEPSPLLRGLTPYPDGWRANQPPLTGLPHFPMVSHRGGYPDGS